MRASGTRSSRSAGVHAAAHRLDRGSRIAVVGAGVSGVVTAKALTAAGYDVTVFERTDDLGGVWSASRAYPGVSTQDDRASYGFSDGPIETDAPEYPDAADLRRHLTAYAQQGAVLDRVRLSTTVLRAELVDGRAWVLQLEHDGRTTSEDFDWLVAAHGTFSQPFIPPWEGTAEFTAAGGLVIDPASVGDGTALAGRRVVVVGWGKTAADIATAVADSAATTDVIARTITWKYPRRLGIGRLTFRHLVLTRGGQYLLWSPQPPVTGLAAPIRRLRHAAHDTAFRIIERAIDRSSGLTRLGLRPRLGVDHSNGLATDGFFEAVTDGRIDVRREVGVGRLVVGPEGTAVELTDGARVPADVVIAATGYDQALPFVDPAIIERAAGDGSLHFYHRILALDIPRFAVVGWAYGYYSPLTSEVSAAWLTGVLSGTTELPAPTVQRASALRYPVSPRDAQAESTVRVPTVPISSLDGLLAELGAPLPRRVRARQWWRPLDPGDYAPSLERAARSIPASAPQPGGSTR